MQAIPARGTPLTKSRAACMPMRSARMPVPVTPTLPMTQLTPIVRAEARLVRSGIISWPMATVTG